MKFLTQKFGPLPAWGWAALGVGGFVLWRKRKANAAAPADTSGTTVDPNASPFSYYPPSGFYESSPQGAIAATPGAGRTSGVKSPPHPVPKKKTSVPRKTVPTGIKPPTERIGSGAPIATGTPIHAVR